MSHDDNPAPRSALLESPPNPTEAEERARLVPLDRLLFGAAWIFIIFAIVVVLLLARTTGNPELDSYGFDLSNLRVDAEAVVSSGMPRGPLIDGTGVALNPEGIRAGGMRAIIEPATITADEVAVLNEAERGKFLVGDDRVVGVTFNGESRAYPLRVLNWHEIINDVVGGVPIAVTYSPLSDSVVVFDRRLNGQTISFAHSGIVYNSNLLMYDVRAEVESSSLWSQLRFSAIAGPMAGTSLTVLPMSVCHWDTWVENAPDTTVIRGIETYRKQYRRDPYGPYFNSGEVKYPVEREIPLAPTQLKIPLMDRFVAILPPDGLATSMAAEPGARSATTTPLPAGSGSAAGTDAGGAGEAGIDPSDASAPADSPVAATPRSWVLVELREVDPQNAPGPLVVNTEGSIPTFYQAASDAGDNPTEHADADADADADAGSGGEAWGGRLPAVYCARFAWHAMYGGLDLDVPVTTTPPPAPDEPAATDG
ncbi:MAG: DUF3179 domain-containing (seleno)protein [Planctomycetota bacterium]